MAKKGNYQIISVRLTQAEYEAAKDAASQESLSLNGFCRQAIIERYTQLLDNHGKTLRSYYVLVDHIKGASC